MSAQTSTPFPTTGGSVRRSKNELMQQWRRRSSAAQWVPGLFWLLWGLAVLLDLALVAGVVLLVNPRWLPPSLLPETGARSRFSATAGFLGDTERHRWLEQAQPLQQGLLFSLATVLFVGGFLAAGRLRGPARWLSYALGWTALLAAGGWAGLAVLYRSSLIGPSPLSTFNEWLLWVGFLAVVLGIVGELKTRRGWVALAAGLVAALVLAGATWWPLRLAGFQQPWQGVQVIRWGLMLPGIVLVAGYATLGLAWALGSLNLGVTLFAPGQLEPGELLTGYTCRWLQVGITLLASAALLDASWTGESNTSLWSWQPAEVWALSPLAWAVFLLLARYHGWLGNFGVTVWSVLGFSALACLWTSWHAASGACLWACWGGLLGCSLAVHASLRHLFWRPL